jgi:hypothetical protein
VNDLQQTLTDGLSGDWRTNAALQVLVDDYRRYHAVFVATGAMVVVLFATLCVWCLVMTVRTRNDPQRRWPFERKVYLGIGLVSLAVVGFFGLVLVANVATTLRPIPGFTALADATTTPPNSPAGRALIDWIRSDSPAIPAVLEQKVQDRLAWQAPKAVVCSLLLLLFAAVSAWLWTMLIRRRRADPKWRPTEVIALLGAWATAALTLLMVVMAVANTQGALAPVTISLLGVGGG